MTTHLVSVRARLLLTMLAVLAVCGLPATAKAAVSQFGTTAPGGSWGCAPADFKYGNRYTLTESGTVTKITAYMRGNGSSATQQRFQTMIYAADGGGGAPGTLVATSQEQIVAGDAAPGPVDFPFAPGVHLVAADYWLVQISGPTGAQACLSSTGSGGLNNFNADPYADGPSNPFNATGTILIDPNLWTLAATYVSDDTTPPTIVGSRTPPANANGWSNGDVTVSFTCTDDAGGTGVASVSGPTVVSTEGAGQSVTGTCKDVAGNTASATVSGINIDKTAPTVAYSGNAGSYTLEQVVSIGCTAADGLSGIASSTCAPISGPAYSFGGGAHTFSAAATDSAGNTASASTSFSVLVTPASLCNLTTKFIQGSGNYQGLRPLQRALVDLLSYAVCSQVNAIVPRLTAARKAALVTGYRNGVNALVPGGWLTSGQAVALTGLASFI